MPAGSLLPLLRDGHGQPGLHLARRHHRHPGPVVRPRGHPGRRRRRAVHVPVRGADDVHRRAGGRWFRRLRPDVAADRRDGRVAVPGRGHETGHYRDAHGRSGDLLRDDGDLAGLDPDPGRRRHRTAHHHRGPGHAARRGQGDRSGDWVGGPGRHARRAVHPGLLGHARLLGRARQRRRRPSTPPAGCTPATWPSWAPTATSTSWGASRTWSSAAARTCTPRDRRVPVRPPRHRGRVRHRGARRPLRGGADGVDPDAAGARRCRWTRRRCEPSARGASRIRRSRGTCASWSLFP